ncbi:MAG TPA: ACP S-malonyltransferase [Chloroflexota bacterium]|nr:ACP S-malonyltransferase [Chloroflexota bacterium]
MARTRASRFSRSSRGRARARKLVPKIAFVFPGQGAQKVGMGASLAQCSSAAREVFGKADSATALPLSHVCFDGPQERLTDTAFAQPGVVAVSLAAAAALSEGLAARGISTIPALCAGHSVGELAALSFSGAVSLDEGLRLVAARGRLMAEASAMVDGTMAAVLGLEEGPLVDVCSAASKETGESVQVANLNAPGQIVISGHRKAIQRAGQLAKDAGARRIVELVVSGPFHSVYMRPAADGFRGPMAETSVVSPQVPLVLNTSAAISSDPAEIRRELEVQVTSPVRWTDSVRTMLDAGCTVFVELGPGQVLGGLIKRVTKDALILNVEDEVSLNGTMNKLAEVLSD